MLQMTCGIRFFHGMTAKLARCYAGAMFEKIAIRNGRSRNAWYSAHFPAPARLLPSRPALSELVQGDDAANERREDAIVRNLLASDSPVAVLVMCPG
jgi:hypothetical protein